MFMVMTVFSTQTREFIFGLISTELLPFVSSASSMNCGKICDALQIELLSFTFVNCMTNNCPVFSTLAASLIHSLQFWSDNPVQLCLDTLSIFRWSVESVQNMGNPGPNVLTTWHVCCFPCSLCCGYLLMFSNKPRRPSQNSMYCMWTLFTN